MCEDILNGEPVDEGWDQFSRFAVVLKTTLKSMDDFDENQFINGFKSLNNNRTRLEFCLSNQSVVKVVQRLYEEMSHKSDFSKNLKKSIECREKANECFRSGLFSESMRLYSEAICLSPYPSKNSSDEELTQLSLTFADRSQVLFRVQDFDSCLEDIEDSIRYNYPIDRRHELLLRKAKCLTSLDDKESALKVVDELRQHLRQNECNESVVKEFEQQIDELLVEIKLESNEDNSDNCETIEDNDSSHSIKDINPLIPNASDSVTVRTNTCNPSAGRTMMATKDISFGQTLIREDPFVVYLYNDNYEQYCYHCLKSLDNRFVPCFGCTQIRFCNEVCLQSCWTQYHSHECNSLLFLSRDIGISYIVLKILFRTGIKDVIRLSKELENVSNDCQKSQTLYSSDYRTVYQLMDHESDHNLESMVSYSLIALFLLFALENRSHIIGSDEDYITLGTVITKHIQQLSTNLISVLDQSFSEEVNKFGVNATEDMIGTALYPTISLLNHSCDPNVLTFFNGSELTVKAAKNIRSDEEINYCYGPNVQRMSRKDRQKKLQNQYYFICQCFMCANHKEVLTRALLCLQCNGPVIHNEDFTSECLNCKSSGLDVRKAMDNMERGLKCSAKGLDLLNANKLSECLPHLHKADEMLTFNLYIQNQLLCKSKDDLCRCYALMGHFDRAVRYCEQSVRITSLVFGEQSAELLMELMKMISLKWEVVDETAEEDNKKLFANQLLDVINRADSIVSKLKTTNGFENAFQSELQYMTEKRLAVLQIA